MPESFIDDFLLYWALLAFALVRGGKRAFGPTFDRGKLDNLTLGTGAASRPQPAPAAAGDRPAGDAARRITVAGAADYDVLLTPTLADAPPRVGHLDPTADYEQIIERLVDWVAFTPLQNVDR